MGTILKPTGQGFQPLDVAAGATRLDDTTECSKPVLPLALRDEEITEGDLAVLLRIATDPKVTAGRYNRIPKRIPAVPSSTDASK